SVEERDRVGVSPMLAADPELQTGVSLPADPCAQPDEPTYARPIDRLEGGAVHDLALDVRRHEFRLDIVPREADRCLRQVVGAKREEVGVTRDPVGDEAGPR